MARARAKSFFDQYTGDLTPGEFQRLFRRDTAEAYRYFTRGSQADLLAAAPWYRRYPQQARLVFSAFTMRLSPARRVLYGLALVTTIIGALMLFRGIGASWLIVGPVIGPQWVEGTGWLLIGFILMNLLILMEVADRLSLKSDLEVARDIQLAMLPNGTREAHQTAVAGVTRPANTVGGDFYDVLPLADGRLAIALGDVAGKGSPAALLMALLVAMMRTLVDEGLELPRLMTRLNAQVARQSPGSRFITLFCGFYDPRDGSLEYVNAGHLPPLLCRRDGAVEHVAGDGAGGLALGMFEQATYDAHRTTIEPGDTLVLFSDGITEAENPAGVAFDESGLEGVIAARLADDPETLGRAVLAAVERHAGDARLADDLTVLVLKRTLQN
jgi:serine phosphatase RsbU (regulator of sigma subunit)